MRRPHFAIGIALSLVCFIFTAPAEAQSAEASIEYRKALQVLLAKCPAQPSDYAQAIEECAAIGPQMTGLRTSFSAQTSRWADDKLSQYQVFLESRVFRHFMAKDDKRLGPDACQHAESAWLNLHQISVQHRADDAFFLKVRPSLHPVIAACRDRFEEPAWGAPLALGKPLPR